MKIGKISEILILVFLILPAHLFAEVKGIDNAEYLKKAKDSSVNMLIAATTKYKAGTITLEQYAQVAMQVSQMADYYNKTIISNSSPLIKSVAGVDAESPLSGNSDSTAIAPSAPSAADSCSPGQIHNGTFCFTCFEGYEPNPTKTLCMGNESFCSKPGNYGEVRCFIRRRDLAPIEESSAIGGATPAPATSSNSGMGSFCGVAGGSNGRSTMGNPKITRADALATCKAKFDSKGSEKYGLCKWNGEVILKEGDIPEYSLTVCN